MAWGWTYMIDKLIKLQLLRVVLLLLISQQHQSFSVCIFIARRSYFISNLLYRTIYHLENVSCQKSRMPEKLLSSMICLYTNKTIIQHLPLSIM